MSGFVPCPSWDGGDGEVPPHRSGKSPFEDKDEGFDTDDDTTINGCDVYFRTPEQDDEEGGTVVQQKDGASHKPPGMDIRSLITVIVLFTVNLLNYMDRFTVAGVLPEITHFYGLNNTTAGLLQTAFVCSYMIFAPIFGYLGDRYNRKIIMAVGIFFWSLTTFAGSFIPKDHFLWFLFLRGLVGIGEASYSTIAPTLIADMYTGDWRSRMLALFYFAIPVGSGLGYIVGANVAKAFDCWEAGLRVTPGLGIICTILVIYVIKEPPRGESEGGHHLGATSWTEDILSLIKNPSFMWSSVGFTCVAFVAGALSWWGPTFLQYSIEVQGKSTDLAEISLIFGVITVVAGILGVGLGSAAAQRLKRRHMTADPLVCAFGMIMSMPFLYFGAVVSRHNTNAAYALIFFGEFFLCLNWSLVADILLYVVIPTRRSSAEAFQILFSHAFGDAGSPYIIGTVSDAIARGWPPTTTTKFVSLEYALFITCFVSIVGGFCFLVCAWFIVNDKKKADEIIKGMQDSMNSTPSSNSIVMSSITNGSVPVENGTKLVNGIPRTSL